MSYTTRLLSSKRKHTLVFLKRARENENVYLHSNINFSSIVIDRKKDKKFSYLSYLIYILSRVINKYPVANSYLKSGLITNKLVEYNNSVAAKFTLDKIIENERIVASGVIENSHILGIDKINEYINILKEASLEHSDHFKSLRTLHKIPLFLARKIIAHKLNNPKVAIKIQGTFSISSLGQWPITTFFPVTTTTLGFGVGRIQYQDKIHTLPLTMAFDHRVIDGSIAGEILQQIKIKIENFSQKEISYEIK